MTFRKERRPLTSTQCNRKKKVANVKIMALQCHNFLHVAILQYNADPSLQVSAKSHFNSPSHTEMRLVLHLSPSLLYRVTDSRDTVNITIHASALLQKLTVSQLVGKFSEFVSPDH